MKGKDLSTMMPNELSSYWMPFTANRAFRARPRLFRAAKDMNLIAEDGREVLDATSGLYCVNAGHCREPITAAIREAAGRLDYAPAFHFSHPEAFRLTSRLAALAPGDLDHVLLANSGSEAVDTAMKVALAYWQARGEGQRVRFIGRERGYHGVGFGGMSVGGLVNNRRAFGAGLPGVDHLPTTYVREKQAFSAGEPHWGAELAEELVRIINLHGASTIAAVVVEPVAGSTGCLPPPQGYLQRLSEIAAQHGILLILDEVITAFGRLGHAFAAERFGIVPDMICFAKGVTNGAVPLSGVIVRKAIHDTMMQGPEHLPELFHGYTYSGHPLGVAAGLACLDVYRDEGLFERAQGLEHDFAQAMLSLRRYPHVIDIRPIGLLCGIDLEPIGAAYGKRGFDAMERGYHECDIYIRVAGDTLVIAPPLIATPANIGEIHDRVARVLDEIA